MLAGYDIDPLLAGLLITPVFFVFGLVVYRLYYETFERRGTDPAPARHRVLLRRRLHRGGGADPAFGVDQRSVRRFLYRQAWSSARCGCRSGCWSRSGSRGADDVLALYLSHTFIGRAIRAVAQDQEALRLMGANPVRIKQWAFGIATSTCALAGALLIIVGPVDPNLDRLYIGRTFCVVVHAGSRQHEWHAGGGAHPRRRRIDRALHCRRTSWAPAISFAMLLVCSASGRRAVRAG